jgi:hypothetical protein
MPSLPEAPGLLHGFEIGPLEGDYFKQKTRLRSGIFVN